MRSKDSRPVWGEGVGKVPNGNSLAAYSTARQVLGEGVGRVTAPPYPTEAVLFGVRKGWLEVFEWRVIRRFAGMCWLRARPGESGAGVWAEPGHDRQDVRFSGPPGYQRSKPPKKPKLGPLMPVIDAILAADRSAPPKQRHTAQRILERLRSEYRVCRRLHGGEGLRPAEAGAYEGGQRHKTDHTLS